MKILAFPFIIFFSLNAFCIDNFDCTSSGLTFLPEKKEISLNSIFIIEGYQYSQKTINSFKNRTVFLSTKKGETIKLDLLKINKGQMFLTQAIFKPARKLKPNTTYFLKISNLTKYEEMEMYKWNSKLKKREPIYWQTSNKNTKETLDINLNIKFNKTEYISFGCGPSINAKFKVSNKKEREIWYRTEVIDLKTKEKKTYIIREWNNQLNVGHGMCAGAFTFKEKRKYKVRFTPMNTDGKMNKTTNWFNFKSPISNNKGFGL